MAIEKTADKGSEMKNKSAETRVRNLETDTIKAERNTFIKSKSTKPQEGRSNRRKPLYQLIEDQIAHARTSDSIQAQKRTKELRK